MASTVGSSASLTPALRVWERELALYRRIWRSSLLGSFVQPLLYLLGMGLGVGSLVDEGPGATDSLGGVSYLAFIAPAMIVATSMNVVSQDSLWPKMDGFLWSNAYRAMTATPVTATQVAAGLGLWHATRALITSTGVAAVLVLFDDTRSWGLLPAVGAGVLTGAAFALPLTAWTATRQTDASFPMIMRFAIVPMFLFGGVFYPIAELPRPLELLAQVTPLYHGVELARGAVLGSLGAADALVHVGVLLAYAVVGWALCRSAFERRLSA